MIPCNSLGRLIPCVKDYYRTINYRSINYYVFTTNSYGNNTFGYCKDSINYGTAIICYEFSI